MQVLNFYSTIFADELMRGRKTATIRLGDKSGKYRKNQAVLVTIGYQYSPRERIFEAVIDQVEVTKIADLSPRDIKHDNPEFRRHEELISFLEQIYGRSVSPGRHRDGRAVLPDHGQAVGDDRGDERLRRRPELAVWDSRDVKRRGGPTCQSGGTGRTASNLDVRRCYILDVSLALSPRECQKVGGGRRLREPLARRTRTYS